jgi:hypothetical protein
MMALPPTFAVFSLLKNSQRYGEYLIAISGTESMERDQFGVVPHLMGSF